MSEFKRPLSVLVVVHTAALDVLMLERAKHPGYWQSVTGSCEPGEDLATTAIREVREETGIDVLPGMLTNWHRSNRYAIFPEWRHRYGPDVFENTEHVFSVELPERVAIQLAPEEHRNHQWLAWEAAAQRCFSWSNRDAILGLPHRTGA